MAIKATIPVVTGEVWATAQKIILRSDGIGSCVVVAAFELQKRIGALAHVMLPGMSPKKPLSYNTKYAQDAINDMLFKINRLGGIKNRLEACLVGGGNVLHDENDTICQALISSVSGILAQQKISIVARSTGGRLRRTVSFDIAEGLVQFSEGDGEPRYLYQWGCGDG